MGLSSFEGDSCCKRVVSGGEANGEHLSEVCKSGAEGGF